MILDSYYGDMWYFGFNLVNCSYGRRTVL